MTSRIFSLKDIDNPNRLSLLLVSLLSLALLYFYSVTAARDWTGALVFLSLLIGVMTFSLHASTCHLASFLKRLNLPNETAAQLQLAVPILVLIFCILGVIFLVGYFELLVSSEQLVSQLLATVCVAAFFRSFAQTQL